MKSAIFDMDGLLIDSLPIYGGIFARKFSAFGIDFGPEKIKAYSGVSQEEIVTRVFAENGINADKGLFLKEVSDEFFDLGKTKLKALPFAIEVLDALERMKVRKVLASSSTKELVEFSLETTSLRKYFKLMVSGDEVKKAKPAPDIFLAAAKKLKGKPSKCVVLEDALAGVNAAKAAGMECIGIATGRYSKEELSSYGIEAYNNLGELLPELERVFNK